MECPLLLAYSVQQRATNLRKIPTDNLSFLLNVPLHDKLGV